MKKLAELLDEVKIYAKGSRFFPMEGLAEIQLHNGKWYALGFFKGKVVMDSGTHMIGFENVAELRGWLRCHRAEYQKWGG